jgi:hypothetical protein
MTAIYLVRFIHAILPYLFLTFLVAFAPRRGCS